MNRIPVNLELKNARIWSAFGQLQTYQAEVPTLLGPNALLAVYNRLEADVCTLGAGREVFKHLCTFAGDTLAKAQVPGLQDARR